MRRGHFSGRVKGDPRNRAGPSLVRGRVRIGAADEIARIMPTFVLRTARL